MSQRLASNAAYLQHLASLSPAQAKKLIGISCKDNIDALCEIVYNVLLRNTPITPHQESVFRKNKALVYKLVSKKVPWTTKRKRLQQSGGFPPLLALLAPLLAPVIGGALGAVTENVVSNAMRK